MKAITYRIFFLMLCFSGSDTLLAQHVCLGIHSGTPLSPVDKRAFDDDSILYIPTVVHVLYQDSSEIIGNLDILAQLESVSNDLRRLNEDQKSTPFIFAPVAVDCKIELCLASIDPAGQPTAGITKTLTNVSEIGLTNRYYQSHLGGQDIWDPTHYLNIWVCQISEFGDIGGFAEISFDEIRESDGVVIDFRYFGTGTQAISPFDRGRTLTHEIGHWLGLEHIWGSEPGCDTDDGIADTPRQFDRNWGCPEFPRLSCGTEDMYMNFMDLTDDACMNLFTKGQKEVMRNTLLTRKPSLIVPGLCRDQTTGVVDVKTQLLASPNPATTYLLLNDPNYDQILIRDFNGKLVHIQYGGESVDVSGLAPGIYIMLLKVKSKVFVQKVVKIS